MKVFLHVCVCVHVYFSYADNRSNGGYGTFWGQKGVSPILLPLLVLVSLPPLLQVFSELTPKNTAPAFDCVPVRIMMNCVCACVRSRVENVMSKQDYSTASLRRTSAWPCQRMPNLAPYRTWQLFPLARSFSDRPEASFHACQTNGQVTSWKRENFMTSPHNTSHRTGFAALGRGWAAAEGVQDDDPSKIKCRTNFIKALKSGQLSPLPCMCAGKWETHKLTERPSEKATSRQLLSNAFSRGFSSLSSAGSLSLSLPLPLPFDRLFFWLLLDWTIELDQRLVSP